jgi:hypothetical protein
LFKRSLLPFCISLYILFTTNSTTVIVDIKGKPRSLFCNKRTVIGKMMHIIIYNEHKFVGLICENKNVLFISHRGSSFCPCILHWTYVFISVKCKARLFRVTPHHFNTEIENQWLKFDLRY